MNNCTTCISYVALWSTCIWASTQIIKDYKTIEDIDILRCSCFKYFHSSEICL